MSCLARGVTRPASGIDGVLGEIVNVVMEAVRADSTRDNFF